MAYAAASGPMRIDHMFIQRMFMRPCLYSLRSDENGSLMYSRPMQMQCDRQAPMLATACTYGCLLLTGTQIPMALVGKLHQKFC